MSKSVQLNPREKRKYDPRSESLERALKERNIKFQLKGVFYLVEDLCIVPMEDIYYGNIKLLWGKAKFINQCSRNGKRILILSRGMIRNNPQAILNELNKTEDILSELGLEAHPPTRHQPSVR